jgi:hypothetical protein
MIMLNVKSCQLPIDLFAFALALQSNSLDNRKLLEFTGMIPAFLLFSRFFFNGEPTFVRCARFQKTAILFP